jgi:hypothetical protein
MLDESMVRKAQAAPQPTNQDKSYMATVIHPAGGVLVNLILGFFIFTVSS